MFNFIIIRNYEVSKRLFKGVKYCSGSFWLKLIFVHEFSHRNSLYYQRIFLDSNLSPVLKPGSPIQQSLMICWSLHLEARVFLKKDAKTFWNKNSK